MAEYLGLNDDELQLFLDETGEHLDALETELLQLEREGLTAERVARIFRAAHTIKGAAATVGLAGMARLTHVMETLFERMRCGDLAPAPAVVAPLLAAVDVLRLMLGAVVRREDPAEPPADLLATLHRIETGGAGGAEVAVAVRFAAACPMPAVRALQVLLALEGLGTVLSSDPTQSQVEAEQVTDRLQAVLRTPQPPAAVRAALAGIPDLEQIEVTGTAPPAAPQPAAPQPAAATRNAPFPAAPDLTGPADTPVPAVAARGGEDRTVRVDVAILDKLMNLVGELVIDRGRLAGIGQLLGQRSGAQDLAEELGRVNGHLARVTDTMQEAVLKARMLPLERVFRKYPRLVRDLARQLGKQVDFRVEGEETELDRSLLEVIGDPLMHLLRNALDHGLEHPAERQRAGKPAAGRLRLVAAHEENHVVIVVQDDGNGIDADAVRAAAVRKGMLSAERAREMGEQEALQLLFAPGFSTREQVTDLSGRGVGLDVVRKNIEKVGGQIELGSQAGQGTTFRLMLPLTLATIRALLVEVGGETLALPLTTVAETLRVAPDQVFAVKGRRVTRVRGRVVPLLWLEQFYTPGFEAGAVAQPLVVVLVTNKGEQIGLVVGRLIGEQEVVVKGLGSFFGQVKGVSGVTILGDGSLALIVDTGGLIGMLAAENNGAAAGAAAM